MRLASIWLSPLFVTMLSGQTVLIVQEGLNRVLLLNAKKPEQQTLIEVGEKPHEIEMSADGKLAYVSNFGLLEANRKEGTAGTTISVIDVAKKKELPRIQMPEGSKAPHGLKLRPGSSRELFTNSEEGIEEMVVFDAKSGAVRRRMPLPVGVHNFVFNQDGSSLFAFTMKGEVLRMEAESGRIAVQVTIGSPRGIAWTADWKKLLVSGKGEVLLLDPESLKVERRFDGLGVGQIFYPAATPDGKWILAPAVIDGKLLVIDAATGKVDRSIATGSPLLVVMDAKGREAWVSNVKVPAGMFGPGTSERSGGVFRLDLKTFETALLQATVDANGIAISQH